MVIRAAVIGTQSYYSSNFARGIVALGPKKAELVGATYLAPDNEELLALAIKSRDNFAKQFEVPLFPRAEDLLAETHPQLVFVCSPNTERARYATMALESGADVFMAKPMTSTLAGAHQIREAARSRPNQLVGALDPPRFAASVREANRRVRAGEIGEVLTVRAWIQHGQANGTRSRAGSPEFADGQGGIEFSLGLYAADLLNWFVDAAETPAVRTFAEYDTLNTPGPGYPWMDTGKAVVRYAKGQIGSMDIHYNVRCSAPQWEIEVGGRDGILRTQGDNYGGMMWRRIGGSAAELEPFALPRDDTMLATTENIVTCCEQRTPFEMDAEDGYRAIELCVAWKQSADTHVPVTLPMTVG